MKTIFELLASHYGATLVNNSESRHTFLMNEENAKGEVIFIEFTRCENPGGKHSLPYLWYKNGLTPYVLPHWWDVDVSAISIATGHSRHEYNPQTIKTYGGNFINFNFMLPATSANLISLFDEIIKRAFA